MLYVVATGELEGVFQGDRALPTCYEVALTYETDVACVTPTSDAMPYMMLEMTSSPRPVGRP